MSVTFPFAPLNMRHNPFGEVPEDERAEVGVVDFDLEALVARLRRPGFAVELTGEAGRGKSTHARLLHRHFPDAPFTYIAEGQRPWRVPQDGAVVFVDESQRMHPWGRRRMFRRLGRSRSFVLATHESHRHELQAAGIEVRSIEVGGLDLDRLRRVVRRRLEWARRGPGPLPMLDDEELAQLLSQHGDDLRGIEYVLYDRYQGMRARATS